MDGELNGQGTYKASDGTKYIGEWKDGQYHGTGTLIFSDGLRKIGEFKEGTDWNTKWYSPDGKFVAEYVSGILRK